MRRQQELQEHHAKRTSHGKHSRYDAKQDIPWVSPCAGRPAPALKKKTSPEFSVYQNYEAVVKDFDPAAAKGGSAIVEGREFALPRQVISQSKLLSVVKKGTLLSVRFRNRYGEVSIRSVHLRAQ